MFMPEPITFMFKLTPYILLAGSTFILACSTQDKKQQEPEQFPVIEVVARDTVGYTDYPAEIHAVQNVEIRARITGYLEELHVDEGAYVKKGQLLFSINKKEYAEELTRADADYSSALAEVKASELELYNAQALAAKKIVSDTEVQLAKSKLAAQKAKCDATLALKANAQLKLSHASIRAPFNGIINRIPHKMGSLIEEGTLLTSISEDDEVYAYYDVSEKEYLSYARNRAKDTSELNLVTLVLADGMEHKYKGVIETTEGAIDKNTGNIAFRARFKNPAKLIKHGASGKVRVQKKYNKVLLVPQKSTFEIQDKLYVYVVDKNNTLHIRNVKSSHRLPHLFIIDQGLQPGEKIMYEGVQNVKEGQLISPKFLPSAGMIKQLASS